MSHLTHPSQYPGAQRPAQFSCIWLDSATGEWEATTNSVCDDVSDFVNWIAELLQPGDRISCILHLMF